jgi:hypothetical protein
VAKLVVVAAAGLGARAPRPGHIEGALAVWGSVAGLASKAALAMGILVAG